MGTSRFYIRNGKKIKQPNDIIKIKWFFRRKRGTQGFKISQIARKLGINETRVCTNLNVLYRLGFVGKVQNRRMVLYYNRMNEYEGKKNKR
jgi:hypothetical protein